MGRRREAAGVGIDAKVLCIDARAVGIDAIRGGFGAPVVGIGGNVGGIGAQGRGRAAFAEGRNETRGRSDAFSSRIGRTGQDGIGMFPRTQWWFLPALRALFGSLRGARFVAPVVAQFGEIVGQAFRLPGQPGRSPYNASPN